MKKSLLITGGCGFIGSNLIHYLLQRTDYQLVNLDALTYAGNLENLADIAEDPRYELVVGDISDQKLVNQLLSSRSWEGIINLAAETHVDRSIQNSTPFIQTNILGTYTLLQAAKAHQIPRYHQVSTDEVYGDLGDPQPNFPRKFFTEDTPLSPHCPYAASKASADLLVQSWHDTYGLNTVVSRCSNNYGPYQFPEKLIPFFWSKAVKNEPLPLYGDGKNIRDWLYVEDHCQAIHTIFEKSPPGKVWNIGGHNEKTNREIADLIIQTSGSQSSITLVEDRLAHDRRYAMDASRLEKELSWRPEHTFEQALPATLEWYQAHPDWVERSLKSGGS